MQIHTLPPTRLTASPTELRGVLIWLLPIITRSVHSREAAISPITKKQKKWCMRGFSLKQKLSFFRGDTEDYGLLDFF
jgi:hypothetical protein